MRVTNNIRMRQYVRNYNRMETAMLKSQTRIETQRRFNRVSEDPINGTRALGVRRQLRDQLIYKDNLSSSKELFSAAEQNLSTIADNIYVKYEADIVAATTGTHSQMENDIFAQNFEKVAEQMVEILNSDFAERRIFGGTNNSTPAFRIETVVMKSDKTENIYNDIKLNGAADSLTEAQFNALDKNDQLLFDSRTNYFIPNGDGNLQSVTKEEYDASDKEGKREETTYTLKENLVLTQTQKERLEKDVSEATDGKIALASTQIKETADDGSEVPVTTNKIAYPSDWEEFYTLNADGTLSVKQDADGNDVEIPKSVTYNGIPLNFNALEKKDGKYVYSDNANDEYTFTVSSFDTVNNVWTDKTFDLDFTEAFAKKDNSCIFPGSKPILVDIGIGIEYDKNGVVDEQTALDISLNGAAITGSGMDSEGFSNNLVQLVLDSAYYLYKGDQSSANAIIDRANEANNHILKQITTLGVKQNSIDFYTERTEVYEISLKERQNVVEGTDMNEEITHYDNVSAAFEAALKLSSSTLPKSIFDFI